MSIDAAAPRSFGGIRVADEVRIKTGGGWFTDAVTPRHDDAAAQVVRTSGSTGEPKAILLAHRSLGDVSTRLVEFMGLDNSIREYVGVPVTYSFGLGRIRAVAAAGGGSFLPEHGFRVDEFAAMLQRGEVNALSAVPTLLRILLSQRDRISATAAAKLRWLEIGSQAMTPLEKEAIRTLFPKARIVQHYGLTEASRSTLLDVSGVEASGLASVGQPFGRVEVRITDEGQIAIRGPNVADGVITSEGVVALSDADGWLVTNDLGHIQDGLVHFDGRADDLINVGGIKVPSEIFEDRLRALVGSRLDFAVAPGSHPLRGQIVVVGYDRSASPEAIELLRDANRQVAREMGVADSVTDFAIDAIPRTDTNKVRRKALSAQFERAGTRVDTPALVGALPAGDIAAIFETKFGSRAQDRSQSFRSLEGDSLSYVDMMLQLEQHLPELPEDWDTRSIDALIVKADPALQVEALFVSTFGDDARDAGASFRSLGGSEGSRGTFEGELRALLPVLPDDWENMSIGALGDIAASPRTAAGTKKAAEGYRPTNLDTVRGLACVMIVALHVLGVRAGAGLDVPRPSMWHAVMDALQVIRLPLFTALAGYIYGAMPATREGFRPFMTTKLKQLAVPVLFLTGLFWALRYVVFGEAGQGFAMTYVLAYEHLWYIYAILLIFAVVALVDVTTKPTVTGWLAVIAVAVGCYWIAPGEAPGYIKSGLLYLPFFVLGIIIQRNSGWIRHPLVSVAGLIFLVAAIATMPLGTEAALAADTLGFRTWLGGAGALVLALLYVPKFVGLEMLAAYSFTIYLWHPIASSATRTLLWKVGIENVPLLFVAGLVAGVAGPVALHLLALRLPKFVSMPLIGK
jgi:surface polysaccharide O-acyltransferase-like enzyme